MHFFLLLLNLSRGHPIAFDLESCFLLPGYQHPLIAYCALIFLATQAIIVEHDFTDPVAYGADGWRPFILKPSTSPIKSVKGALEDGALRPWELQLPLFHRIMHNNAPHWISPHYIYSHYIPLYLNDMQCMVHCECADLLLLYTATVCYYALFLLFSA